MAQLAPVIEKLEDVAEPARQFYVQKDGKFALDLAGAPSGYVSAADLAAANARVVEFRDTNIALKKTVDEQTPKLAAFEGIDAKAAREALAAQDELKKKGITKPDDVTAAVNSALETFKSTVFKPIQDQLTAITTSAAEERKKNSELVLRAVLSDKFTKAGGIPDAFDFVVNKSTGVFVAEGGTVKAAPNQFSSDKPGEPLSVDEWMTRLTKESSFAFKPSGGGGANPQASDGRPARPAGQLVLRDPTPQQLGAHAKDISSGKMRVEYTNNVPQ